jgi:hypothetical protein
MRRPVTCQHSEFKAKQAPVSWARSLVSNGFIAVGTARLLATALLGSDMAVETATVGNCSLKSSPAVGAGQELRS